MPPRPYDERLLRQSFEVARKARDAGEHPFGSLLADKDGNVLREQPNGYKSGGGVGPLLADEAAQLHIDFWKTSSSIAARGGSE